MVQTNFAAVCSKAPQSFVVGENGTRNSEELSVGRSWFRTARVLREIPATITDVVEVSSIMFSSSLLYLGSHLIKYW